MTLAAGAAEPDIHDAAAPEPFKLVDHWQAGYLKFAGREPRTLQELALARADYEHQRRRAEVKAMAKKLELLDPFLPALFERGLKFSYRNIGTQDKGKTLRIECEAFSLRDDKLYAALIELGFHEVDRSSYSPRSDYEQVTLKHGRALLLKIDVTKKPAAPEGAAP
jgi:hypothetical protein